MRGETEGTDRGDEGRDRGGATTEEFGRGRWATVGGEGKADKKVRRSIDKNIEKLVSLQMNLLAKIFAEANENPALYIAPI